MWPTRMSRPGRLALRNATGRSSKPITGSRVSWGRASTFSTSSMQAMYLASSCGTHHIFFRHGFSSWWANTWRMVAWCRDHLPGIEFKVNSPMPPMPANDGEFDVVYCYSVFTHLSEEQQFAWSDELHRVLRIGGTLVLTTNG